MGGLPLVHAFGSSAPDDALGVAQQDIVGLEADRLDQVETGDAGRARAIADEARGFDVAAGEQNRVDHTGGGDDRSAVLIVVEDRNVHQFAQALFNDEALGRLDVLKIDAAERRPEVAHGIDESFGVFGVDFQIDGIDVGEALE